MKITNRDKKMLYMLGGLLLLALSYILVYRPQMDKASQIATENDRLQSRLNELLEMKEKQDFYETETSSMKSEVEQYCKIFPADIKEEDGILLAKDMENKLDIKIASVGTGEREFIASMDGSTPSDSQSEDQETLMEQSNETTKEQVNEIEGISDTEEDSKQSDEIIDYTPTLYRTQDTLQYEGTYAQLKDSVEYLKDQTGRMTIDSINLAFDSSTGGLSGTMNVNLFSMTGTDAEYHEPNPGSVSHGVANPFGTLGGKN